MNPADRIESSNVRTHDASGVKPRGMARRGSRVRHVLQGAALCGFAVFAGCNIIGAAYMVAHGPEKNEAQYELARDRSVVVFVDSQNLPRRTLRNVIGTSAQEEIRRQKLVNTIVDTRSATDLTLQERFGQVMDVATIGRQVGADSVVFVTIDSFGLTPDGSTFSPAARVRVKVIDAPGDKRLWPTGENDPYGRSLTVVSRDQQGEAPTTSAAVLKAEEELGKRVGLAIAQMFYEHEKPFSAAAGR